MSADSAFAAAAIATLTAADPAEKAAAARQAAAHAATGPLGETARDWPRPPDRPARPAAPLLRPPGEMPRRRLGGQDGRLALLHAVAHIEFNAIDLAFDMALRFAPALEAAGLDWRLFVQDWAGVGDDEARHFLMICGRLAEFGAAYGDLPAHDGLWEAALATRDDPLARLAIAPMVLEARGLDVTPGMIEKLQRAGDEESASILSTIYAEEISHVAAGVRWFKALCEARAIAPVPTFRRLVGERFAGELKPPFNQNARGRAGMAARYYAGGGPESCSG